MTILERFRRVTSGSAWIPEIDGLRFIAILSVILFHLYGEIIARSGVHVPVQGRYDWLARLLSAGDRGVRLFFVISGFILGRPFAQHHLRGAKPVQLKRYFLRRLTRLEPPYILSLIVVVASMYLYQHGSISLLLPALIESMLYSYNLIHGAIFGISWSLEVEVQFYLLVPLLTQAFRIRNSTVRRLSFLVVILLLGIGQSMMVGPDPRGRVPISVVYYLQYFLTGMLLSDLYLLDMPQWRRHWMWDAVGAAAWPLIFLMPLRIAHTAMPFLILPAYIAAFRGPFFNRLFRAEWIALIGGMCYSLYLWHFFLIALAMKASRYLLVFSDFMVNYIVQAAVVLPVVLGFGALYYLYVERPCMDPEWPRKLQRWWEQKYRPETSFKRG